MQNNLRNRSVALASTFALALTGIVATAPAASANTTVELKPTSGSNLGAFITDDFSMDVNVPTNYDAEFLAFKIDNPSQEILEFEILNGSVSDVVLRGFDATGAEVDFEPNSDDTDRIDDNARAAQLVTSVVGRPKAVGVSDITGGVAVDFKTAGITSLVIESLTTDGSSGITDGTLQLDIQLKEVLDASAPNAGFEWGDGNQGDITVTSWIETEASADYTTIDTVTASAAATVKFYDPAGVSVIPSIERFVDGNGTFLGNDASSSIAGKVQFIRPDLNLNQVDLSLWNLSVRDTAGNVVHAASSLDNDDVPLAGMGGSYDRAGAVYFNETTNTLSSSSSYTIRVQHSSNDTSNTRTFNSAGFTPATNDTLRTVFPTVTDSTNAAQAGVVAPGTSGNTDGTVGNTATLRPGTDSFTYKAQLHTSVGTSRDKAASQSVVAVVTAGAYMPTGTQLTVAGSNTVLDRAGEAAIVSGLTDSNGEYSVTVTSSNPIALTSYTVEFKTIDVDGTFTNAVTDNRSDASANLITATYTAATVSGSDALTLDNSVFAGDSISIVASVEDSYGVGTNKSGSNDLYVTAQGTSTSDLNSTVAVGSDGKATISFANYIASGESDLVSVYLHTGATYSSSTINIDTEVVSLYNPDSVAAVNVPASVTGVITYDDFITGTASSTNVAPNDGTMTIAGTAVDANGSGVPGAVVTVSAPGMQLRQTGAGAYAQDSITIAASAAGAFSVDVWSHTVNATGADVTITTGGQSATTKVKTYLPTGLDGNNLVFSMDAPANIDVNKTYAIQASLTDKWGNPVQTTGGSVDIVGVGSVEINSAAAGAENKNFGRDGKVTVFVRSIKDIEGPGTISATLSSDADYTAWNGSALVTSEDLGIAAISTDVASTVWDETDYSPSIELNINVGEAAATSSDQKVNAGSFKGFVALYAKGYEGQRMSAIVAGKWLQVDSLASDFERVVRFTGAGYDIKVRIYIDGEQVGPEFDILTK